MDTWNHSHNPSDRLDQSKLADTSDLLYRLATWFGKDAENVQLGYAGLLEIRDSILLHGTLLVFAAGKVLGCAKSACGGGRLFGHGRRTDVFMTFDLRDIPTC